jgi:hypothetical protein
MGDFCRSVAIRTASAFDTYYSTITLRFQGREKLFCDLMMGTAFFLYLEPFSPALTGRYCYGTLLFFACRKTNNFDTIKTGSHPLPGTL